MLSIKHILTPVDFSDRSNAAAAHAAGLVELFGADLTLMHVAPTVQVASTYRSETEMEKSQKAQIEASRLLEAKLQSMAAEFDPPARAVLAEGEAARCIEDYVAAHDVDLLVMGTHGLGKFRRYLLGSLTSKVLYDLKIPIVTGAHLDSAEPLPSATGNVGCAVDLHEVDDCKRILRWSSELAKLSSSKLTVIHVPRMIDESLMFAAEARDAVLDKAAKDLADILTELNLAADVVVESGDPMNVITHEVKRKGCDVLVIGRTAKRGPFRVGHADGYAVIREVEIPVFSI